VLGQHRVDVGEELLHVAHHVEQVLGERRGQQVVEDPLQVVVVLGRQLFGLGRQEVERLGWFGRRSGGVDEDRDAWQCLDLAAVVGCLVGEFWCCVATAVALQDGVELGQAGAEHLRQSVVHVAVVAGDGVGPPGWVKPVPRLPGLGERMCGSPGVGSDQDSAGLRQASVDGDPPAGDRGGTLGLGLYSAQVGGRELCGGAADRLAHRSDIVVEVL
jgi:hypothetical protein